MYHGACIFRDCFKLQGSESAFPSTSARSKTVANWAWEINVTFIQLTKSLFWQFYFWINIVSLISFAQGFFRFLTTQTIRKFCNSWCGYRQPPRRYVYLLTREAIWLESIVWGRRSTTRRQQHSNVTSLFQILTFKNPNFVDKSDIWDRWLTDGTANLLSYLIWSSPSASPLGVDGDWTSMRSLWTTHITISLDLCISYSFPSFSRSSRLLGDDTFFWNMQWVTGSTDYGILCRKDNHRMHTVAITLLSPNKINRATWGTWTQAPQASFDLKWISNDINKHRSLSAYTFYILG